MMSQSIDTAAANLRIIKQDSGEKLLQVLKLQERSSMKRSASRKMSKHQIIRINGCCKLQDHFIQQSILFIKLLFILTVCSFISNVHSIIHHNQSSHIFISNLNQQAINNKISPKTIARNLTWFPYEAAHDMSSLLSETRANRNRLVDLYLKEQDFSRLFSLGLDELMRIIYKPEEEKFKGFQKQDDLKKSNRKSQGFQRTKNRKRRDLEERGSELLSESATLSEAGLMNSSKSDTNKTTEAPRVVHMPELSGVNATHMQLIVAESSVPPNHQAIPREELEDSSSNSSNSHSIKSATSKSAGRSRNRNSKAAKKASRERETQVRLSETKGSDEYSTPVVTSDKPPLTNNNNDVVLESPLEPMRYNDGIASSNEQSSSISSVENDYQAENPSYTPEPIQPQIVVGTSRGLKSNVKRRAPASNFDHSIRYSSASIPAPEQNPLRNSKLGGYLGESSPSIVDSSSELDENNASLEPNQSSQTSPLNGESINESVILDHSGNNNKASSGMSDEQIRDMIRLVENHGLLAKSIKKPNQQHKAENSYSIRNNNNVQTTSRLYNTNSDQVEDQKLTPVDNVSRSNAPYEAIQEPSVIPIAESNQQQHLVPTLQQHLSRHNQLNQAGRMMSSGNQFEPSFGILNDNTYLQHQVNPGAQKTANTNYPSFSAPLQQSSWISQTGSSGSSKDRGLSGGKLQLLTLPSPIKDHPREVTKIPPPTSAKLKASESRQHTNTAEPLSSSSQFDQFFNPRVIPLNNFRDENSIYEQNNFPSSQQQQQQQQQQQNQVLGLLRAAPQTNLNLNPLSTSSGSTSSLLGQHARLYTSPSLIRRTSPLLMLNPGTQGGTTNNVYPNQLRAMKLLAPTLATSSPDYLPLTAYSSLPYLNVAAAKYNRAMQQQQHQHVSPTHRTMTGAYQNRIGRVVDGNGGATGAGYDETGAQASMSTASTSDPMWSNSQNHEEDYQQSPQTIQITAVPNGLGLANGFNGFNGVNGWNGLNGFAGGWGGPWNGRQVLLVNKQPQVGATGEWRNWLIPIAIILALPLILGALFVPVFLKSVMFLIQILQMLGLLMPPSQLASHLLSNSHNQSSG